MVITVPAFPHTGSTSTSTPTNDVNNNIDVGNYDDSESWARYLDLVNGQNAFNSAEAQKNRDWNEFMRDSQVSSYMNQLKENGVNPILAVNSGYSGASYQSSATGQAYSGTSPYSNSSRVDAAIIRALGSIISAIGSSAIKLSRLG